MTTPGGARVPPPRDGNGHGRVRGRRGGMISIPSLARRGRATLRQFLLLLGGGYIAWVESRRERTGGRGLLFKSQAVLALGVRLFVDPQYAGLPFPVQLRRRLEELGPTYVKLGQILSLRTDILPSSVTDELQNLLSRLPEIPFERITEIVEADLGRPIDEMFASIDPRPLASASIAQTHRAETLEGDQVILKVVKPGIRELLYRDAALLRMFGRILQWIIPQYQPKRVADEFCEFTLREVEMELEAENTETFAENFSDMPEVVFPRIYRHLTGRRVLCEEFLEGVTPDSDLAKQLTEAERRQLIDVGAAAIIRMLYEDGFFHADLHPGNMMVMSDLRIGFIDLGMVGRIDSDLRLHLFSTYYGMVMGNFDQAARHLSEVAQTDEKSDVPGFRRAMRELCRKWRRSSKFEQESLAMLMLHSVQLGARYRMYYPVELVLMVKALITYEGVGYMMDPSFDVAEVSERHLYRIFRSRLSPASLFQQGLRAAPDLVEALVRMPQLVTEGLRILEQQTRRRPERPLTGIRGTLFGGFALVSGAILVAFEGPWPVAIALIVLGLVVPLRRGR